MSSFVETNILARGLLSCIVTIKFSGDFDRDRNLLNALLPIRNMGDEQLEKEFQNIIFDAIHDWESILSKFEGSVGAWLAYRLLNTPDQVVNGLISSQDYIRLASQIKLKENNS